MAPTPAASQALAVRRVRSLVTDALGSAIAARWASGELQSAEVLEREALHAALLRAEQALHAASATLQLIDESDHRHEMELDF